MKKIIFGIIIVTGLVGIILISIGGRKSVKSLTITKNSLLANSSDKPFDKEYSVNAYIKEIYIEANTIEFKIVESQSYSNIEISANNFLREDDLEYSVDNNILNIKSLATPPIGYGHNLKAPKIILKIPSNMKFDIVSIISRASDIEAKNISSSKIIINNNIGKVDINIIENNSIVIDNKMGDVKIKTTDIEKYKYNIKNSVGNVEIGNKSYEGIQNEVVADKSHMNIEVQNSVGNVSII